MPRRGSKQALGAGSPPPRRLPGAHLLNVFGPQLSVDDVEVCSSSSRKNGIKRRKTAALAQAAKSTQRGRRGGRGRGDRRRQQGRSGSAPSTGSTRSSTCTTSASSNPRHTWKMPSTALMWLRKALPRPWPCGGGGSVGRAAGIGRSSAGSIRGGGGAVGRGEVTNTTHASASSLPPRARQPTGRPDCLHLGCSLDQARNVADLQERGLVGLGLHLLDLWRRAAGKNAYKRQVRRPSHLSLSLAETLMLIHSRPPQPRQRPQQQHNQRHQNPRPTPSHTPHTPASRSAGQAR